MTAECWPKFAWNSTTRVSCGPALKLLAQQRRRPVLAAVVDEHALVGDAERVERRIQAREQGGQHLLLVVDGDDDAEFGRAGHGCPAQ